MDNEVPVPKLNADRTIDSHIKRLRRKLTRTDPEFESIETVYGLGYRYRQIS